MHHSPLLTLQGRQMHLLQVSMHQGNQPEEKAESQPGGKETRRKDQQHVAPLHVQQGCEDVLEVLHPTGITTASVDVAVTTLGDDPFAGLCDGHIPGQVVPERIPHQITNYPQITLITPFHLDHPLFRVTPFLHLEILWFARAQSQLLVLTNPPHDTE